MHSRTRKRLHDCVHVRTQPSLPFSSRYTFVEDVAHPHSVTILLKGHSDHVIAQIKDAVRDGLRAVKNTLDDQCVLPGGLNFKTLHVPNLARS